MNGCYWTTNGSMLHRRRGLRDAISCRLPVPRIYQINIVPEQDANIDNKAMSGNGYVVNNAVVFRPQAHDNTLPSTIMALSVQNSAFLEVIQKLDPSSTA